MRISTTATLSLLLLGCTPGGNPTLPTGNFAVVTTSGGMGAGGAVNTIRLSDRMVVKGLDTTIDQDNNVRIFDGKAYVLNRTPGSMYVYDVKTWMSPVEITLGDANVGHATANPQDLWVKPGSTKVYVSFYGNDGAHAVGIVDTSTPDAGVVKWIDIPTTSKDPDGRPEPSQLYGCNGKLYVMLADLDSTTTFAPTGLGRVAVIDTATDGMVGIINLQAQNPYSMTAETADCSRVLVADSGPFGLAPDGTAGIERVDLGKMMSLGMVISDATLQGRPSGVSVLSPTLAFVTLYFDLEPQPSGGPDLLSQTKVIAVNPTTGTMLNDVTDPAAFIAFTSLTPDGDLIVGVDAYPGAPATGKLTSGIYLGKADGTKLPSTPIDLGQNPYAIAFQ